MKQQDNCVDVVCHTDYYTGKVHYWALVYPYTSIDMCAYLRILNGWAGNGDSVFVGDVDIERTCFVYAHCQYLRAYDEVFGTLREDYHSLTGDSIRNAFRKDNVINIRSLIGTVQSSTFDHHWMNRLGVLVGHEMHARIMARFPYTTVDHRIGLAHALWAQKKAWRSVMEAVEDVHGEYPNRDLTRLEIMAQLDVRTWSRRLADVYNPVLPPQLVYSKEELVGYQVQDNRLTCWPPWLRRSGDASQSLASRGREPR